MSFSISETVKDDTRLSTFMKGSDVLKRCSNYKMTEFPVWYDAALKKKATRDDFLRHLNLTPNLDFNSRTSFPIVCALNTMAM